MLNILAGSKSASTSAKVTAMDQQRVWLKPALSGSKRREDYACSLCADLFRPNPNKPFDMLLIFGLHVGAMHPGAKLRRERNHFSQAPSETVSDAPENK
jgi:hypothetical protein